MLKSDENKIYLFMLDIDVTMHNIPIKEIM